MVYVGVDLHRKRSHLVGLDDEGNPLFSRHVASTPEELLEVLGGLDPERTDVAFEATFGWGWFADLLAEAGISAHMAHPLGTKAISSARVKNDAVDARTLAHLLRTNLLPEAWIAPPEVREVRRLTRGRVSLVRVRTRLKCQVHAILADHGVDPEVSDLFGVRGRQILAELDLPELSRGRIEAMLRLVDALSDEVKDAERELRRVFRSDERIERLQTIPGIGFVSASTILAEVWDVSRFPSPRHLCSWAGLTPTEHSSAEHTHRGHISKQGSRWLRWILVEAASRRQTDPQLRRFHDGIARRRGTKIARVALARRLLTLCYYALRDDVGCQAYPLAP